MRVELLHLPGCAGADGLAAALAEVLARRTDVQVVRTVVDDGATAAATGMAGSPTLLVDGVDPFAGPGPTPGLSCRLYIDEHGTARGVPSTAQLRAVLRVADRMSSAGRRGPHPAAEPRRAWSGP